MYRIQLAPENLENPNTIENFVLIILPNYFFEYDNVIQDLIRQKYGIVEKTVKNMTMEEVMEWKSVDMENEDIWSLTESLVQGPCMILLCQRANAFIAVADFVDCHNKASKEQNGDFGIYHSKDTVSAYQDILYFFPDYIDEKQMMAHAKDYLSQEIWPKLSKGLARVAVERPENPIKWLSDYLKTLR